MIKVDSKLQLDSINILEQLRKNKFIIVLANISIVQDFFFKRMVDNG